MSFTTELNTRSIRGTNKRKLTGPLTYKSDTWSVTVPAGFISNGANIPWPFRMAIPRDGRYRDAAWVHDYLYSLEGGYIRLSDGVMVADYTRQTANQIMDQIMDDPDLNVKAWRRAAIMLGLKIGSRFAWNQCRS